MKLRWTIWLPFLLLCLVGGIAIYGLVAPKDQFIHSQMVGKPLPRFAMEPAMPGVQGLSDKDFQDGRPRLLNIFGSWCLPCQVEAPYLAALADAGVEIHAIALHDKPEDVAAFLQKYGNPFVRIGSDYDMRIQLALGSTGVPETYVIGGDGRVIYQHIGDIRAEHVPLLLEKLRQAQ